MVFWTPIRDKIGYFFEINFIKSHILVLEDTSSIPFGSEMRLDFGKEARAATISGWFKLYGKPFLFFI